MSLTFFERASPREISSASPTVQKKLKSFIGGHRILDIIVAGLSLFLGIGHGLSEGTLDAAAAATVTAAFCLGPFLLLSRYIRRRNRRLITHGALLMAPIIDRRQVTIHVRNAANWEAEQFTVNVPGRRGKSTERSLIVHAKRVPEYLQRLQPGDTLPIVSSGDPSFTWMVHGEGELTLLTRPR